MKTITTMQEVRTRRYRVELIKIDCPSLNTCYSIHSMHIGKNARWYNSHIYAWTEITALRVFKRKVLTLHQATYGQ